MRLYILTAFGPMPIIPASEADELDGVVVKRCLPEQFDSYPPEIPVDECPQGHGQQRIVDAGGNSGFAGEGVWWANLACGHQVFASGTVEDWMIR